MSEVEIYCVEGLAVADAAGPGCGLLVTWQQSSKVGGNREMLRAGRVVISYSYRL